MTEEKIWLVMKGSVPEVAFPTQWQAEEYARQRQVQANAKRKAWNDWWRGPRYGDPPDLLVAPEHYFSQYIVISIPLGSSRG